MESLNKDDSHKILSVKDMMRKLIDDNEGDVIIQTSMETIRAYGKMLKYRLPYYQNKLIFASSYAISGDEDKKMDGDILDLSNFNSISCKQMLFYLYTEDNFSYIVKHETIPLVEKWIDLINLLDFVCLKNYLETVFKYFVKEIVPEISNSKNLQYIYNTAIRDDMKREITKRIETNIGVKNLIDSNPYNLYEIITDMNVGLNKQTIYVNFSRDIVKISHDDYKVIEGLNSKLASSFIKTEKGDSYYIRFSNHTSNVREFLHNMFSFYRIFSIINSEDDPNIVVVHLYYTRVYTNTNKIKFEESESENGSEHKEDGIN